MEWNFLYFEKKKTYVPLFLGMGFNCLKATATSRRQFTFYHSFPRKSEIQAHKKGNLK